MLFLNFERAPDFTMKNSQKITRIRLEALQYEGAILFGIVSHEPDYKLSLALNQKIGISLKHGEPIIVNDDSGHEHSFSRFATPSTSPDEVVYTLASNRSGTFFMLKKLKNIDYLFHINNSYSAELESEISAILRETESVNAVFPIDIKTFNDKNISYLIQ